MLFIGLKLSFTDKGKSFGGLNFELASGTGIILHLNSTEVLLLFVFNMGLGGLWDYGKAEP